MIVSNTKLISLYKKIDLVKAHHSFYLLCPAGETSSVKDLHWVVQDMYDLKIDIRQVSFAGLYVRGILLRFSEGRAIIYVKNQPEDWMRFTAVKELCQLVLDEQEDWSVDYKETIGDLLLSIKIEAELGADYVPKADTTVSEELAKFAAMELLYPNETVAVDRRDLDASLTTFAKIAARAEIPTRWIALAHSQDYQRLRETVYGWIHNENNA